LTSLYLLYKIRAFTTKNNSVSMFNTVVLTLQNQGFYNAVHFLTSITSVVLTLQNQGFYNAVHFLTSITSVVLTSQN
jgi:uncharacterized membrane protein